MVAALRRAWSNVIPFFAFPPAVRRVIYTTNALERVNARLRKIIKTRGLSVAIRKSPLVAIENSPLPDVGGGKFNRESKVT